MAADLGKISGVSNSPLFIGWTPFQLDFSPYQRNQVMQTQMMMQLAQSAAGARAQAAALKVPEAKGLSPSLMEYDRQAAEAIQAIQTELSGSSNPFHTARHSPTLRENYRKYANLTSPAHRTALEEEQKSVETLNSEIAKRREKNQNVAGDFLFDSNGRIIQDPRDPGAFLTPGAFVEAKYSDPRMNLYNMGKAVDPNSVILASPDEYRTKLGEKFKAVSFDENSWKDLKSMEALQQQGTAGQLAYSVIRSGKGASNEKQIFAALEAELNNLTVNDRAAILNGYKNTPDFIRRYNNGEFHTKGNFDDSKVYEAAFNTSAFENPLAKGKEKVSFAQQMVLGEAAQQLFHRNAIDASLMRVGSEKGSGSGGNGADLQIYDALRARGPMPVRTEDGLSIAAKSYGQPIAVEGADGKVRQKIMEGQMDVLKPDAKRATEKLFGLITENGTPVEPEKRPLLSQILPGTKAIMQGGRVLSTDDLQGFRVKSMEGSIKWIPEKEGSARNDIYWTFEVEAPENMTDKVHDYLVESEQNDVTVMRPAKLYDSDYKQVTGNTSTDAEGEYDSDWWDNILPTAQATTTRITVKVPHQFALPKGQVFLTEEQWWEGQENPEIEKKAMMDGASTSFDQTTF